jgi:hypothetical protein
LLIFTGIFAAALVLGLAILYLSRLTVLFADVSGVFDAPALRAGRYRPMLRLLSEEDLAPVRSNGTLLRRVRAERAAIFRGYLRCMGRDYGRLLASLSLSALYSEVDRPDIAWTVFRNRVLFAATMCRLDLMLFLYRFGIRGIDVSGLLAALEMLSAQTPGFARSAVAVTA